jgi:carboxyl-terminal processing protease
MRLLFLALCLLSAAPALAADPGPQDYRADARSIHKLIDQAYAYLDRFERGKAPISARLDAEAEQVSDRRSLIKYAERALLALADHHAITGASTAESWAVVPTYSDLWIERKGRDFVVTSVRSGSPAEAKGIRPGDLLQGVGGVPIEQAVAAFWTDLDLPVTEERASFAARVLAAGRRNAPRQLEIGRSGAPARKLELPSLYSLRQEQRPPLEGRTESGRLVIRFHNSLGDDGTVAAFDAAMAGARPGEPAVIDLTDTPSGGNTVVARAIMGWFVTRPRFYQIHNLPAEERETGIPRQWAEQVLPRPGKYHRGRVTVLVGRWTGSMGEGLAIGFHALGADVVGERMAGLRGAVYDHKLDHSGLVLKLPTERLYTVDGRPRENFAPARQR